MNKTSSYLLTIIVPVFNEEGNMLRLEKELAHFLQIAEVPSCVLFVDDGSKDSSPVLIKEICRQHSDFFYLGLTRNSGLSAALKAGIDYTQSKYVGYIDADLQTSPEDFNLLLKDVEN